MSDASGWIQGLQLRKHPEGGYFRETYRSEEMLEKESLPKRFGGRRAFSTSIYFLLNRDDCSVLHRLKQDEVWHFYEGSSLTLHVIDQRGHYSTIRIGRRMEDGEVLQAVVKAGCAFGATVTDPRTYSLVGCTVAPGFEFDDLEVLARDHLVEQYPQHKQVIERLTR